MNYNVKTVSSRWNAKLRCKAIPGHFATSQSHVNYYLDMIEVRSNYKMARIAGQEFARLYMNTPVDTIICLEGTEVIGAFLAEELSDRNIVSVNAVNADNEINILVPELTSTNQMVFRENTREMVMGKNILLLISSTITGRTARRAVNMLRYYDAHLIGIGALYSVPHEIEGIPVHTIFSNDDLPDYCACEASQCPMCQQNRKLDGVANGYGYTRMD